jgi:hypothetical protein
LQDDRLRQHAGENAGWKKLFIRKVDFAGFAAANPQN